MFSKWRAKTGAGWVGVVRQGDRLDLAHVIRGPGARPEIRLCESFRVERDLVDALQRLGQSRNLKQQQCTTLLSGEDYRLAQQEAPDVPAAERVQAMRWRLKDMVDFPLDDAAIAIADIPGDSNRQPGVFAIAAPAARIVDKMKQFADAKLSLAAIDIPEMAVRNVAELFEQENRGLALLHVSAAESLLVVTWHGELVLSRHMDVAGDALEAADPERRGMLLERLALELQRTLDNFDRQFSYIPVARMVVAAELQGEAILEALRTNLYLPVAPADLAEVADFPSLPELRDAARQAQALLAIGAAMRTAA